MGLMCSKSSKQTTKTKCDPKLGSNESDVVKALDKLSPQNERRIITCESTLATLPYLPLSEDEDAYDMSHPRRGMAIIFNHKNFVPQLGLSERKGTERDKEKLCVVLEQLNFEVLVYDDLNFKDVERTLESISAETDHNNADCILVVVLTHGEEGILYAKDYPYKTDKIWEPFNELRCPSLAGKPKLFFIQACRGDQFDQGVTLTKRLSQTQTDSTPISCKIPNDPDYLVVYSTIEGFYSWRNVTDGSWFIQALCQVLSSQCKEGKDILSCMTVTARTVAFNFQSDVPTSLSMNEMKQVPCINSTLIRDVIFTAK